jgi:16S rRNA (guanine527-N7)-methyltransferase
LRRPTLQRDDIGAGAGLPGIVIAILTDQPITLCEPRRLRAEFLRQCVTELSLSKVTVLGDKIERLQGKTFDFITARAVASLGTLFDLAFPLSRPDTRWILPKGRSGAKELAEAQRSWQGRFRTVPSITDGQAVIVVAEQVEPRAGLKGGAKR